MVKLYNKQTNEFLGRITEEQLRFLADQLEEESVADKDYYIKKETLETFEQSGAAPGLVDLLRSAMRPSDAIEIRWEEDSPRAV